MMKLLFNPFERYSEKQLVFIGITSTIIGSLMAIFFNARFDGILDLHFVEKIKIHEPIIDLLIDLFCLVLILFLIGRDNVHVGASVLIYAEFAFLFFSGIFRRNLNMKRISMAVGFVYGYTVWYMFPIEQQVSWEGHISGFICGIMLAWYFRKQGPPEPVYRHEVEPELSDEDPFWLETIQEKDQKTTLSDSNSE